jgi:hypothetical protein
MYPLILLNRLNKHHNSKVFTFHRFHDEEEIDNFHDLSINISKLEYFLVNISTRANNLYEFTIDDGYFDVLKGIRVFSRFNIKPILFINMNNILSNSLNWWDYLEFLHNEKVISIGELKQASQILRYPNSLTQYLSLFKSIRNKSEAHKDFSLFYDNNRLLSVEEIKDLVNDNSVVIGNHFAEHVNAACLTTNEYKDLFYSNHSLIEKYLNVQCSSLAFPYGLSRDIPFFYRLSEFTYKYYSNYPGNNRLNENDLMRLRYNLNENNIVSILNV